MYKRYSGRDAKTFQELLTPALWLQPPGIGRCSGSCRLTRIYAADIMGWIPHRAKTHVIYRHDGWIALSMSGDVKAGFWRKVGDIAAQIQAEARAVTKRNACYLSD